MLFILLYRCDLGTEKRETPPSVTFRASARLVEHVFSQRDLPSLCAGVQEHRLGRRSKDSRAAHGRPEESFNPEEVQGHYLQTLQSTTGIRNRLSEPASRQFLVPALRADLERNPFIEMN